MTSAKITKTVQPALEEWQRLQAKRVKIESARDEEIKTQQDRFDRACAPINDAAGKKLAPISDRQATLEAEIDAALRSGISPDKETVAVARVESSGAVAEVKDDGKRVIDPQEFFKEVREADRTPVFWTCLNVLIGKSEKFLTEAVMKRLAKPDHKYSIRIRLKQ